MTHKHFFTRRLTAAGVFLVLSAGCSSEPQTLPEVTVDAPQEFEADGALWKQQPALTQADTECLSKFFEKNGDLAGSPDFEGQPTVYLAGKNDRRFYWLLPSAEDLRWCRVEFRKRKFNSTDGTGNPFQ